MKLDGIPNTAAAFGDIDFFIVNLTNGKTAKAPASLLPTGGVGAVESVNGLTGVVVLGKSEIGLGNVPNVDATARANHTGVQAISTVTGLQTALDGKADASATTAALALKANASDVTTSLAGKADLVAGKVPSSQIPTIAITEFLGAVANEAAMLALSGQRGDWCIRSDEQTSYVLIADDATSLASWLNIPHPLSPVQSVNGQTGVVVLGKENIGLTNVDNYQTATQGEAEAGTAPDRFMTPQRTAQAIAALAPVKSVAGKTGIVTLAKGDVGLANVENYGVATQGEAEAGAAGNKYMTPERTAQAIAALAPGGSGSGKVAQVVYTTSNTGAGTTATIYPGVGVPTDTDGDAFPSLDTTITPTNAGSLLIVDVEINIAASAANEYCTVALFLDGTSNAVRAASVTLNGTWTDVLRFRHIMPAGSTAAKTFKIRFGGAGLGGLFINTTYSIYYNPMFAAAGYSTVTITEILP